MNIVANGIQLPQSDILDIAVHCDQVGETLPTLVITGTGGALNINRSAIVLAGTASFHLFASEEKP